MILSCLTWMVVKELLGLIYKGRVMNWILLPIIIFMAVLHFIEYIIFHYLSLHHFKHKTYAQLIALDRYANGLLGGDFNVSE